jgi:predicted transcriptional regulator
MKIQALETFTARDVASLLNMPLKEATNDLIRLRKMGFLTRRKVPRECFLKSGFDLQSRDGECLSIQ